VQHTHLHAPPPWQWRFIKSCACAPDLCGIPASVTHMAPFPLKPTLFLCVTAGGDLQQAMSTRRVTPGYTAKSFISYLLGHAARPGVQGPLRALTSPLHVSPGGRGHHHRRLQGMSRTGDNATTVHKSGTPTSRTPAASNAQRPVRVPYNNSSTARNRTAAEVTN
jgi:hypothetical protein